MATYSVRCSLVLLGSTSARREAWVHDRDSELLFAGCVKLGNDNRLWPLASRPSVRGSLVVCLGKSELLAVLLPRSATMTYSSVSCLCSTTSRGNSIILVFFGFSNLRICPCVHVSESMVRVCMHSQIKVFSKKTDIIWVDKG